MTVLRQEKSAIIEKLNTVFTGVIHHGGTRFIQPKKDGEMTEKICLRLSKVAILSALYGCLTKNQTVISGEKCRRISAGISIHIILSIYYEI